MDNRRVDKYSEILNYITMEVMFKYLGVPVRGIIDPSFFLERNGQQGQKEIFPMERKTSSLC